MMWILICVSFVCFGKVDGRQCMVVRLSPDEPLHSCRVYVAVDSDRAIGHLAKMIFSEDNHNHLQLVRPLSFATTIEVFGSAYDKFGKHPPSHHGACIQMYNISWERRRGHANLDIDPIGMEQHMKKWEMPLVPIIKASEKRTSTAARTAAPPSSSSGGPAVPAVTPAASGSGPSPSPPPGGGGGSAYPVDENGFFDVMALLIDTLGPLGPGAGDAPMAPGAPDVDADAEFDNRVERMLDPEDGFMTLEEELSAIIDASEVVGAADAQIAEEHSAVKRALLQKATSSDTPAEYPTSSTPGEPSNDPTSMEDRVVDDVLSNLMRLESSGAADAVPHLCKSVDNSADAPAPHCETVAVAVQWMAGAIAGFEVLKEAHIAKTTHTLGACGNISIIMAQSSDSEAVQLHVVNWGGAVCSAAQNVGRSCTFTHPHLLGGRRWAKWPMPAVFKPRIFEGCTVVHPAIGLMVRYAKKDAFEFTENHSKLISMYEIALSHKYGEESAGITTVSSCCNFCKMDNFTHQPDAIITTCAKLHHPTTHT